ncbi:hypothetical protein [Porphyrobacter sp. CACIAM 03H1]|uniref:hypothetical protein n=1 Tax=Porphyrobacter sp. CACIAM 03H1 TaxID=2003315 RepID=UPI000B5A26A5|nr:hypothetical protein [Porphyrobacter sp. CACIAM 03H1]ASJ90834.1 hypothetical protein CBR61_07805 [Porphyrobacter sp. CACIAM 03H1]
MRLERALIGLHAAGVVFALVAALAWPRPGQAALLVPLGTGGLRGVLAWADRTGAPLLALDSASGRVIARISDNRSLLHALSQGIVPVAARAPGCRSDGG